MEERRLAAIMFTDIVDYTAMMEEDEQSALHLIKQNRELQQDLIEKHNGTWLKEMGDGTLSSFSSTIDAVNCAIEIQNQLKDISTFNLRIGIHLGDVVFTEGDVFGNGVNVASRIEATAVAGGISISGQVYDTLVGNNNIEALYLGEKNLKNVNHPVKVYSIVNSGLPSPAAMTEQLTSASSPTPSKHRNAYSLAAAFVLIIVLVAVGIFVFNDSGDEALVPDSVDVATIPTNSNSTLPNSVAVLPFENLSLDPEDAYFAIGLHGEILNQLVKLSGLNIIAGATMRQYTGTTLSISEIANELNVETVLEGSVQYANGQVRVSTQLINPATSANLWSETYQRELEDIFQVESDIAMNVANSLAVEFSLDEKARIEQILTSSPEAYALYLSVQVLTFQNTRESLALAIERIDRALELDPEFAHAWAWKAATLNSALIFFPERFAEFQIATEQAVSRALELNPNLGLIHQVQGYLFSIRGEWQAASEEYQRADEIGLSPAELFNELYILDLGYIQESNENTVKLIQTDPLNPGHSAVISLEYDMLGDTSAATAEYERGREIFEDWDTGHFVAFTRLLGMGEHEQAKELASTRLRHPPIIAVLEYFDSPELALLEIQAQYADETNTDFINRLAIATLAAYFDDQELALSALTDSVDEIAVNAMYFWVPLFQEVRQLEGFKNYMRENGFVDFWRENGWPDLCEPVGSDDFVCR